MKTCHFKKIILFSILLGLSQVSWGADCTQTLSPGANVASAVSSAAAGSTICLNNGDFGNVNLAGINKSNYVTVQSVSGRGATISPQIGNSKFLRFTNLTISGANINACSSNIQLTSSTFTQGAFVSDRGFNCTYPLNITIDGSTFSNLSGAGYEGRISVVDDDGHQPSLGVIISNNEIKDGCKSDGVFLAGGASGVQIGPGNVFNNIVQSGAIHCDNIQVYGSGWNNSIIGNHFKTGSSFLMLVDSFDNGLIKNNIFDGTGDGAGVKLQIAQTSNTTIEHNTLKNAGMSINLNSTATIKNNAFINSSYNPNAQGSIPGCSNCATSYNLSTSAITGTNNIQGTPTLVDGASPTTWAGWQLTSGSLGYRNSSDGNDRGINYYGSGAVSLPSVSPLAAPSNLRVN
ncbi:MAG: hypothetical protein PSU93_13680 [Methylobacter sp.]|uniref:Right handed beta helix domain-containing protein n=1 Tax=Candidatus Methylobacter titanis TaxID=3053457 RepID=A0AA43Q5X5_9GAMM|nr:hypothetical protein [Candidatus Methylobacter titanis]